MVTGRSKRRAEASADEALVAHLVQEHGGALIAYATRLTGDRYTAEDVVQETLMRAWQRPEVLANTRGSVRGWLFTVARNIIIDQARPRAARPREVAAPPGTDPVTGDHSDEVVDTIAMTALLDELSPDHRQVLVELYYRGRTVTRSGERSGHPAGHREVPVVLRPAGTAAAPRPRARAGGEQRRRLTRTSRDVAQPHTLTGRR